jgi:hypothetical protein
LRYCTRSPGADHVDQHLRHIHEETAVSAATLGVLDFAAVAAPEEQNQVAAPPPRMTTTPAIAIISFSLPFSAATASAPSAACQFGICHRPPAIQWSNLVPRGEAPERTNAPAHTRSLDGRRYGNNG